MDATNTGGDRENSQPRLGKRQYQRHTIEQIHRLESYFKEYANPDEHQREELSREIGLDPVQIKFWFQNKRTQKKTRNEKEENYTLRSEKDHLLAENIALKEAIKSMMCPNYGGPVGENIDERIKALILENKQLREQIKNTANLVSGQPGNALGPHPWMEPSHLQGDRAATSGPQLHPRGPKEAPHPLMSRAIRSLDMNALLETAASAMNELVELLSTNEPVWVNSADGRCTLHCDTYDRLFPASLLSPIKSPNARIESSKDSVVVAIPGENLFQVFLNTDKWKDMFPTIVTDAKTIEVLDARSLGGSVQLMYEKVHVLSPHVAPREFVLLRYCRQLSSSSWAVADVSFDLLKKVPEATPPPLRYWKFPSGCVIEDASHGKSNVKWLEHIQVDDKQLNHRLYKDLVRGSQAYGAKRWIASLRTTCERSATSLAPILAPQNVPEGVIDTVQGRNNLMKLSHRMVQYFNEALDMSDELDFSHMSEVNNTGLRVSIRKRDPPGQPEGLTLAVATSLWLPLSAEVVFNFLNDETLRPLWDVLANRNPVKLIARISTGSHVGNNISIIQPYVPENNLSILQETIVDSLGAMLVYTPVNIIDITEVVRGGDAQKVEILPSGYIISRDGRAGNNKKEAAGASSSEPSRSPEGSLLTVVLQILVSRGKKPKPVSMETVTTIHSLISTTVEKIREGLNCAKED